MYLGMFTLLLYHAEAQDRTVTGTVTSAEDGSALPGVNVVLKGTTIGTVTDIDGNYSINVPSGANTLVYSFIGLTSAEEEIGNRSVIDVVLQSNIQQLGEVVVTAIGIEREKRALGYSVENLEGQDVQQVSEPDPIRALQGKVAGVNIGASSGAPGSSTRITIRGNSSLLNDNQPLFVVDGVPYNNDYIDAQNGVNAALGGLTGGGSFGSRIADLDPNNIESITVLKGGAAAALYGTRAANGVVVITTKTGSAAVSNKGLEITYSTSYSFEEISNLPDYQNAYGTGTNFAYAQANGSWGAPFIGARPYATVDSIPHWYAGGAGWGGLYDGVQVPYRAYPDNVKDFFETGHVYENSITISGGRENTAITATLSQLDQSGFVPETSFKRHAVSVGGNSMLENGFRVGGSLSYTRSVQDGVISGVGNLGGSNPSAFARTLLLGRNWDLQGQPFQNPTDNGSEFMVGRGTANNPYWSVENTGITAATNRYVANLELGYDILEGLNVSTRIGLNGYTSESTEFQRPNGTGSAIGQLNVGNVDQLEINGDLLLTYNTNINEDFTLRALGGLNINQRTIEDQLLQGSGYVIFDIDDLDNMNSLIPNGGIFSRKRIFGVYADVTAGYRDWAYITLTGRNDWSSTLPEDNRSFFYPAVTGAVILSDALNFQSSIVNTLKVRGGWSQVGNDTDPYLITNVFIVNDAFPLAPPDGPTVQKPFDGRPGATLTQTASNPDLKPEQTTEYEAGIEAGFFNERIRLDATYYKRNTTDQIIQAPIPEETGFAAAIVNVGEVSNEGVEIGLNLTPVTIEDGFHWDIYGTFTKNKNIVEELGFGVNEIQFGSAFAGSVTAVHRPGEEYGQLLGSVDYRDEEGNLLIDPSNGQLIANPTPAIIGNPNPDFTVGLFNTFSFKGIQLSFVFDWKEGGDIWSNTVSDMLGRGVIGFQADREINRIIPGFYADPTTGEPLLDDSGNKIPNQTMIEVNSLYFGQTFASNASDEWLIFDGTTYRLREVTLSYSLPQALLEATPFGDVSISLTGRNLWYLAPGFHEDINYDPETNQFGGQRNNQGIEYSTTPSARRYGINLRVSF